jgi:hypothetical protein
VLVECLEDDVGAGAILREIEVRVGKDAEVGDASVNRVDSLAGGTAVGLGGDVERSAAQGTDQG